MIFLCIPLVTLFGMLGGQINKLFRPIGISLSIIGIYLLWHNHPWWCVLPSLIYGFILTLGYGEHSKLYKWLKDEDLVMDMYGFLCCIPPIITLFLTLNILSCLGVLLVFGAFQIRLGSWGKIGKYDIEANDFFKYLSIGISMSLALL